MKGKKNTRAIDFPTYGCQIKGKFFFLEKILGKKCDTIFSIIFLKKQERKL